MERRLWTKLLYAAMFCVNEWFDCADLTSIVVAVLYILHLILLVNLITVLSRISIDIDRKKDRYKENQFVFRVDKV